MPDTVILMETHAWEEGRGHSPQLEVGDTVLLSC